MDPQVEALLQMMAAQAQAAGVPPLWELDPATARANAELSFQAFNQPLPASVTITDRTIPGPAGEIPAKIFTPAGQGPFPLVVYFHGGGWVIGSPATHTKLCAELAEGAGAVVVSVHYRLAPEHTPPAQLDDCVAAVRWAVDHAAELNADGSRFALAGDSAGGNLAACAALRLRDEGGPQARLQLLLYAALTGNNDLPSVIENAEGKILTRQMMDWFYRHYLSGGADPNDPYIFPIHGDLRGLPPAHLIVGTLDPLLDDSKLYAEALQKAGVPAKLSIYQDQPHIFLQLTAMLDGAKKGMAEACEALRTALA
ncbi:alpha/beta hydrolase [Tepidiforma thermophila]|uniref:Acetyl esterase n=1 Tax=Tepidiforma thermophila (strain KCTC 52669 / CGMCC 1.13589 / G233) TaxID=2761530 RepID=A0A2A9HFR3_TEPT2|nr:alpha/beta hydrolase [Tepidiforma thermophila]PFG73845.1 acetyl esterase [Tepidiforma thermophila]